MVVDLLRVFVAVIVSLALGDALAQANRVDIRELRSTGLIGRKRRREYGPQYGARPKVGGDGEQAYLYFVIEGPRAARRNLSTTMRQRWCAFTEQTAA